MAQSVTNFLYDRLIRPDNSKVERYAFMKKVEGRYLWAKSAHDEIQAQIDAYQKEHAAHNLVSYQNVTSKLFGDIPEPERTKWQKLADEMNEGNGPDELKAQ